MAEFMLVVLAALTLALGVAVGWLFGWEKGWDEREAFEAKYRGRQARRNEEARRSLEELRRMK